MELPVKHDTAHLLEGVHVLVVEDDFLLLLELQSVLTEAGAEIAGVCRTIAEALAAVERDDFEVAVLDVRLGRAHIGPVAGKLVGRGVPFVFYTGQAETEPLETQWPGARVVSKPALPRSIVEAVASSVGGGV